MKNAENYKQKLSYEHIGNLHVAHW